ncbi:hypothetical protein LPJ56_006591, partial [Coemansia sp. RSA 2599]
MPKPKKFKLAASFKQLKTQKARSEAARVSQQRRQDQEKQQKPGQKANKPRHKPRFPYTASDTILLVGEGNFSFASSLASKLGTASNIVATAYDSLEIVEKKYGDAKGHIAVVERLGGTVLFDVDATALEKSVKRRVFSHVVFNFPHAGAGIKDQTRNVISNQRLLMGFFASAKPLLVKRSGRSAELGDGLEEGDGSDDDDGGGRSEGARKRSARRKSPGDGEVFEFEGARATVSYEADPQSLQVEESEPEPVRMPGQIHVTLKSGPPYSLWNVRQLAKDCGFVSLSTVP